MQVVTSRVFMQEIAAHRMKDYVEKLHGLHRRVNLPERHHLHLILGLRRQRSVANHQERHQLHLYLGLRNFSKRQDDHHRQGRNLSMLALLTPIGGPDHHQQDPHLQIGAEGLYRNDQRQQNKIALNLPEALQRLVMFRNNLHGRRQQDKHLCGTIVRILTSMEAGPDGLCQQE